MGKEKPKSNRSMACSETFRQWRSIWHARYLCYPTHRHDQAASVASQWLELLHQDTKGQLAVLRRSKKRDQSVIHTELPLLMSREFSCNQKNDPYVMENSAAGCSNNASVHADVHQARWNALFEQMDKGLCEEEKQLHAAHLDLDTSTSFFSVYDGHGVTDCIECFICTVPTLLVLLIHLEQLP